MLIERRAFVLYFISVFSPALKFMTTKLHIKWCTFCSGYDWDILPGQYRNNLC